MSEAIRADVWALDRAALAAATPSARVIPAAFTPLAQRLIRPAPATADFTAETAKPERIVDPAEIEAQAYARGLADGQRLAEDALDEERRAMATLARNLEALRPGPSQELALMLAAAVDRLVRQVVGEVEIDALMLLARAKAAAALIAEEAVPGKMRLHPDDVARLADAGLPCELVPDAGLTPGTVLLETRDGWIEHGPEVALNRLGAALDQLGAPR